MSLLLSHRRYSWRVWRLSETLPRLVCSKSVASRSSSSLKGTRFLVLTPIVAGMSKKSGPLTPPGSQPPFHPFAFSDSETGTPVHPVETSRTVPVGPRGQDFGVMTVSPQDLPVGHVSPNPSPVAGIGENPAGTLFFPPSSNFPPPSHAVTSRSSDSDAPLLGPQENRNQNPSRDQERLVKIIARLLSRGQAFGFVIFALSVFAATAGYRELISPLVNEFQAPQSILRA